MKKILWALVALMMLAGAAAYALDIRAAGLPKYAADGAERTVIFKYATSAALPSGFLVFNGDGSEFFLRMTHGDTLSTASSVPGNILVPAPQPSRISDMWVHKLYINCATDSVAIYPVFN